MAATHFLSLAVVILVGRLVQAALPAGITADPSTAIMVAPATKCTQYSTLLGGQLVENCITDTETVQVHTTVLSDMPTTTAATVASTTSLATSPSLPLSSLNLPPTSLPPHTEPTMGSASTLSIEDPATSFSSPMATLVDTSSFAIASSNELQTSPSSAIGNSSSTIPYNGLPGPRPTAADHSYTWDSSSSTISLISLTSKSMIVVTSSESTPSPMTSDEMPSVSFTSTLTSLKTSPSPFASSSSISDHSTSTSSWPSPTSLPSGTPAITATSMVANECVVDPIENGSTRISFDLTTLSTTPSIGLGSSSIAASTSIWHNSSMVYSNSLTSSGISNETTISKAQSSAFRTASAPTTTNYLTPVVPTMVSSTLHSGSLSSKTKSSTSTKTSFLTVTSYTSSSAGLHVSQIADGQLQIPPQSATTSSSGEMISQVQDGQMQGPATMSIPAGAFYQTIPLPEGIFDPLPFPPDTTSKTRGVPLSPPSMSPWLPNSLLKSDASSQSHTSKVAK